ncbi:MAG TPA: hypothetical protein VHI30_15170 [Gaiellales bacterium]|jgi:magnesium-protoporphyrin O-methyltransferase|nr:hypothetical protein [Gaiellales bacterium]
MSCCTPAGYRTIFGARTVERDARRYRRKGLTGSAAWLRDALVAGGVDGRAVSEIGGGIGALQIELVEAGAARAANVEIVETYEPAARELIAEHGVEGRVERRIGDVVGDPELAPAADIVVMHRVICCYPDADRLMSEGCVHARERVAITIPTERWWVRLGVGAMNAWLRLRRVPFQAYVHPYEQVAAAAERHGFRVARQSAGRLWQSSIFERAR